MAEIGRLVGRAPHHAAGVVDQAVEPSEHARGFAHAVGYSGVVGGIEAHKADVAAEVPDLGGHVLGGRRAGVILHDHLGAHGREADRDGSADPAGAARDEDGLAGNVRES